MKSATQPRPRDVTRLLAVDTAHGVYGDGMLSSMPPLLRPGDLLVVNDAATLPASLPAHTSKGDEVEIRLLAYLGGSRWQAAVLGEGNWRTLTERRPAPPRMSVGELLVVGASLSAQVLAIDTLSPRLLEIEMSASGAELWTALYRHGSPVQYAHLREPLELWDVQTNYAGRPWALEMPSAGRPLSWSLISRLRANGIQIALLTHAAGISSTGDPSIDATLPLPERYDIPATTTAAIARVRRRGGRVIAVGTTVVRALEGNAAQHGFLKAGPGTTDLVLDGSQRRQVIDGLLTGMHAPTESHFRLLQAFADHETLRSAWRAAERLGYRAHEFGDVSLLVPHLSESSVAIDWQPATTRGHAAADAYSDAGRLPAAGGAEAGPASNVSLRSAGRSPPAGAWSPRLPM